jgi:hypothetical protein
MAILPGFWVPSQGWAVSAARRLAKPSFDDDITHITGNAFF